MRGKSKVLKVLLIVVLSGLFCAATVAVAPAGEVNACCGAAGWYFAEGYTGGDFDTWILIQNPNQTDAIAHLRFFTPGGEPISLDLPLDGESRTTVYLNTVPGLERQEVSTEVKCEGEGVIAERAMYFNYNGGQGSRVGGHSTIGADGLSTSWYLPEGYTGGTFDTYILLMNPGDSDANVWVKLMKPDDGRYYPFKTVVPAGRRKTIKLDELIWVEGQENVISDVQAATAGGETATQVKFDSTDVSTLVLSMDGKPVMAERAMYFDYKGKAGGSSSIGAKYAAQEWYLPEGYTGGDFDTWVMAMNPNSYAVDITYTFYTNTPGFEPVSVVHPDVKPYSRDTINVDDVPGLEGTDVSTKVTAMRQVKLAEVDADPVDRYAVVFGIDDYPSGADLLYAEDDAVDIKHRLYDQGGFEYQYCLGEGATLDNFQAKMDWLASAADANDIAVFFFGGRSFNGTENNIDLYDGSVSRSELEACFAAMQTENFVAMFSCDNSGELAGELAASGRLLLASCGSGEVSHEFPDGDFTAATGDYGNGAWAYYFVEALGKKAADSNGNGRVSAEEAHAYLVDRVTALVLDKAAADQVPEMYDGVVNQVDLTVDKVPASIVAERSVYFNYNGAIDGANSIGASRTYPNWFLAEGYTGGSFDTYVLIMNPYDFAQKLTVTFMTPNGVPIAKEYTIGAKSRKTIKVDEVPGLEATDVSTRVFAQPAEVASAGGGGGVVVERAMYFTYVDPIDRSSKAGGSCSIGYGSW
ncbi:MAG: caspase family protein [Actinomycetota bacterium]|nr:caspase family protein [Actinomycetota bacterium]